MTWKEQPWGHLTQYNPLEWEHSPWEISSKEPFGHCYGGKLIIVRAFHYTEKLLLPSRMGLLQEIHSLGLVYKLLGKHDPTLVKNQNNLKIKFETIPNN